MERMMMRSTLTIVALCLGMVAQVGRAAEATAEEKAFFEKNMGKLIKLEPTPMTGDALGKVFTAKFYLVKMSIGEEGALTTLVVARSGNNLAQVTTPGTTAEVPALKALVKPGFKLKADADGKTFESALDLLYPIDERFDKEDMKLKAVTHAGTEWTFVRGKFFDDLKGWVVKTDASGTITSIGYSLNIKK
jgi:hypothetical protein